MRGWIEGFQESIDFMEQNMTEDLDIEEIAGKAALSPFYYQRIFGALCGMTVGEYIRARRMTLAAQELNRKDVKVIDVAVKYRYDSPDSFTKTFQKFHGITPSQAREPGAPLRSFAPLHIRITMEGGSMLDYNIVEKAPFTIIGVKRPFNSETSYQEIPKFWDEWMAQGENRPVMGTFGVCIDMKGKDRSKHCRIQTQRSGQSGCLRFRDIHWQENMTSRFIFRRKTAQRICQFISGCH